jgi:hypothetical protein
MVFPIAFALPVVAALAFYFRKRDLYNRTRPNTKPTVLIITSLIAIFCFGLYVVALSVPIISGVFLGASLQVAFEVLIGLSIVGLLLYASAVVRARRMGIDLSMAFQEIPPE